MNKAIVTVLGKDRVGIIATVSTLLSVLGVNIIDITQTVLESDLFVMLMLVELDGATESFPNIKQALQALGESQQISIRIQSTEIFDAMHKI